MPKPRKLGISSTTAADIPIIRAKGEGRVPVEVTGFEPAPPAVSHNVPATNHHTAYPGGKKKKLSARIGREKEESELMLGFFCGGDGI